MALALGASLLRGCVTGREVLDLRAGTSVTTGATGRGAATGAGVAPGKLRVPMRRKVRGVVTAAGAGVTGVGVAGACLGGVGFVVLRRGGGRDLRADIFMVGAKTGSSGTVTSGSNISSSGEGARVGKGAPKKLGTRRAVVRGRLT